MDKKYKYYLIVAWKTGKAKVVTRKPKSLDSKFVMLPINLVVNIPENIGAEISTEVKVSTRQVKDAMIDEI